MHGQLCQNLFKYHFTCLFKQNHPWINMTCNVHLLIYLFSINLCMCMHMRMVMRKYMPMNNQAQLVTSAYH
jgi:hypothetical protein